MKKTMKLFLAAIGLALCVMANAEAASSIKYTVGGLQVTLTDLGVLPTGTFSSALAINNLGEIAGSANVVGALNWESRLPIWDANTGAVVGMADTSGAAIPEHRNDNGEMVGTDCVGTVHSNTGMSLNEGGEAEVKRYARIEVGRCEIAWREPR